MRYQHSPCLDDVQIRFCLIGRQNQSVDIFIGIYIYLVPKKLLLTLLEYLAGVNSQGGSAVLGVKNCSDPSLCRSLGEETTGELKHFFHEHFGNLEVEKDAGWIGEAQVSCL